MPTREELKQQFPDASEDFIAANADVPADLNTYYGKADEKPKKRSKYNATKTLLDGITFDSGKEAKRYQELSLMLKAGQIFCLQVHVRFPIPGNAHYEGDFVYLDEQLNPVIEDVKSEPTKTRLYRLKKKLFFEKYGKEITEV